MLSMYNIHTLSLPLSMYIYPLINQRETPAHWQPHKTFLIHSLKCTFGWLIIKVVSNNNNKEDNATFKPKTKWRIKTWPTTEYRWSLSAPPSVSQGTHRFTSHLISSLASHCISHVVIAFVCVWVWVYVFWCVVVCVFEPTASSVIDGMPYSQVLINLSNTWRRLIKAFCCKIVLYSWGKSQQIHFPMKCLIEHVKTAGVMRARL